MNKIFITILLLLNFNFSFVQANPSINARTAIVVDYHSDKILYEYEPDIQIYPASMTKILTVYVAFDRLKNTDLSINNECTPNVLKIRK